LPFDTKKNLQVALINDPEQDSVLNLSDDFPVVEISVLSNCESDLHKSCTSIPATNRPGRDVRPAACSRPEACTTSSGYKQALVQGCHTHLEMCT
jgi:hypothetical protein